MGSAPSDSSQRSESSSPPQISRCSSSSPPGHSARNPSHSRCRHTTQEERSIEPPAREPFSTTRGSCPSWRRRAAATRPAIPAPATVTRNSGQRERRLVLDVLDPNALGTTEEDRERVRSVDPAVDLDPEIPRGWFLLVGRIDEDGQVVEERLTGI